MKQKKFQKRPGREDATIRQVRSAPVNAPSEIFPSVAVHFNIFFIQQEQYVVHHKVDEKQYVYIQFIIHVPPSFSFALPA